MMECRHCHSSNPPTAVRCTACNSPLELDGATMAVTAATVVTPPKTTAEGWSVPSPASPAGGPSLATGSRLGTRYEIIELLGQGGMGVVYKAKDREIDRIVALKVIRPELAVDSETLQRFKQELILARQIAHRNVIRIFDLGEANGSKFITMEFIDGQDLKSLLNDKVHLGFEETVRIIEQVCWALEAAHN